MHHPIVLVTGPPFSGVLWEQVCKRLESHQLPTVVVDLLDPVGDGTLAEAASRIRDALDAQVEPLLVAHGTAIPAALLAAQQSPPAGLVLTNGALNKLDPALRAISRLPAAALHPRLWLRYLASSAALRRVVVNPYVMDRDTVVAVCEPGIRSAAQRRAQIKFLRAVAKGAGSAPAFSGPTLMLWGDEDHLYPIGITDSARTDFPQMREVSVPGGRHLHPIERPWYMADEIRNWCALGLTTT
ncbi:MAG: pimeloyl-ACP methyl ester carboxylesterase [Myxococcota bacterium]|jgi:pimeloyl-ACP methyl ester carboxylesterase